ncbi:toxin [Leifsonia sp. NPDC058194]|uniref:toxin n=1 Tax=Leifsonia sp. NPDC058194 TaxID=3346374 RepID=UPI0036DF8BF2
MKVHDSARRHGVLPEDSIQAATWALWIDDLDEENPGRQLRLGFDTHGRLLEIVVLVFDSGNELIIHAMKARPQMIELLP